MSGCRLAANGSAHVAQRGERHVLTVAAEGLRLDRWLTAQLATLSRARVQALIAAGRVTVDGAPTRAGERVRAGQQVVVVIPPPVATIPRPEELALDIAYEDRDLLVLDKPAGLVVHPAPGHAAGTLVNALLHHCRDLGGVGSVQRPGIVHRLDKETSGLMVVAKHEAALLALTAQFPAGRVGKTYLALVHGLPTRAEGTITAAIGRHAGDRKRMAANPVRGKPALSHYRVVAAAGGLALLRVRIETGRTHQIRVHLAHLGHPVAGDPVYGKRARDRLLPDCPARQMLHAAELEFDHPADGRRMFFRRPPPADMRALLQRLGFPEGLSALPLGKANK